jgi:hypothetical protein
VLVLAVCHRCSVPVVRLTVLSLPQRPIGAQAAERAIPRITMPHRRA